MTDREKLIERLQHLADSVRLNGADKVFHAKHSDDGLLVLEAIAELSRDRPLVDESEVARAVRSKLEGLGAMLADGLADPVARDIARALIALLPGGEEYSKDEGLYSAKPRVTPTARTEAPQSTTDYQQRRGVFGDIVDEAVADYAAWMADDDFDASGALHRIMARMGERRALYTSALAQPHVSAIGGETEGLLEIVRRFIAAEDEAPDFGLADCIDNAGHAYQSADFAALIIDARAALSTPPLATLDGVSGTEISDES